MEAVAMWLPGLPGVDTLPFSIRLKVASVSLLPQEATMFAI